MGGDRPRPKAIFVWVHRTKISKCQVGEGSPTRGRTRKSAPTPEIEPHFLEKYRQIFFKFQSSKGSPVTMISIRQIPPSAQGEVPQKKPTNFTLGA